MCCFIHSTLQDKPTFSFSGLNDFLKKDLSQGEVKELSPKLLQSTQFYFRKLNIEHIQFQLFSNWKTAIGKTYVLQHNTSSYQLIFF